MKSFKHDERIYQFGGGSRGGSVRKVSNTSIPTGRNKPVRFDTSATPRRVKQGSLNNAARNLRKR